MKTGYLAISQFMKQNKLTYYKNMALFLYFNAVAYFISEAYASTSASVKIDP
jgi:hypothetical protein